jgi:hypothetical protein
MENNSNAFNGTKRYQKQRLYQYWYDLSSRMQNAKFEPNMTAQSGVIDERSL